MKKPWCKNIWLECSCKKSTKIRKEARGASQPIMLELATAKEIKLSHKDS